MKIKLKLKTQITDLRLNENKNLARFNDHANIDFGNMSRTG